MSIRSALRRNRWILLAIWFLLVNTYAVYIYSSRRPARESVRVVHCRPTDGPLTGRTAVRWRFSRAMVRHAAVGTPLEYEPAAFAPVVSGIFRWTRPDELTFEPTAQWRACTRFTAALAETLCGVAGEPLAGPRTFRFASRPLSLRRVEQSAFTARGTARLVLEFSDPVSRAQLHAHLLLATPEGQKLSYRVVGDRTAQRHELKIRNVPCEELVVRVKPGLQSTSGPLGLTCEQSRRLKLSRVLRLLSTAPEIKCFEAGNVTARFNFPLDLAMAADFIRTEPPLALSVESRGRYWRGNACRILADFEPGRTYTVRFLKGLPSRAGPSLASELVRNVYFPDRKPAIRFTSPGHYLSAAGSMRVPIQLVNLERCNVRIHRVYPNNLVQLAMRRADKYRYYYGKPHESLSRVAAEFELTNRAQRNVVVQRHIALDEMLGARSGAFLIEARGGERAAASHFVVLSDTGLSVKMAAREMLVWANSLRSLAPIAGAEVRVFSPQNQVLLAGHTDRDGLARLAFDEQAGMDPAPFLVTVRQGEDITFLRLDNSAVTVGGSIGARAYHERGYEAFLFSDRGIYRPGETAHIRAVVRGVDALCPDPFPVTLRIHRPDGKRDRTFNAMLNAWGTAEFNVSWPDYLPTGRYRLSVCLPASDTALGSTSVALEDFVPPQIRVRAQAPTQRVRAQTSFEVTAHAEHLFGRPAAGLRAEARAEFSALPFQPKGWSGYRFEDSTRKFRTVRKELGKQVLDSAGRARWRAAASPDWRPGAAIKALIGVTVFETGGRTVSDYASCTVDPFPFYVGIRRENARLIVGRAGRFELAAVRPDGTAATGAARLRLTVAKLSWTSAFEKGDDGRYRYVSEPHAARILQHDVELVDGRGQYVFTPEHSGQYRISVRDPGSGAGCSVDFYASTDGQPQQAWSLEHPDKIQLELDKDRYDADETATLLIKAPFSGKALVSLESTRVLEHQIIRMTGNTARVRFTVRPEYRPNVYCSVTLIRPVLPAATWAPHRAAGSVPLRVSSPSRRLDMHLTVPARIRPNRTLEVPVQVLDHAHCAARAEVVVAAVDEGICMLTDFRTPDPFAFFFAPRTRGVALYDLYAALMPETAAPGAPNVPVPGGGMSTAIRKRLNPIRTRRFKPVALCSSRVETDPLGRCVVRFDVPEFTGTLRLMAAAVGKQAFGAAEARVFVRRPLVVQSSLPRVLAPSDSFLVPLCIRNETGTDGDARIALACTGPLHVADGARAATQTLFVANGNEMRTDLALRAGTLPGKATFRLEARLAAERFEETIELPVRPASSRTVRSGVGTVPPGQAAALKMPGEWLEGTGLAKLWLAALPDVKLAGGLDYLLRYPYGCIEQTTSCSFPLLYLRELAERLYPGRLDRQGVAHLVDAGIHRVLSMQRSDGGFGFWPGAAVYPWGSIYATHFLVEAADAGYQVPADRLQSACRYIERWLARGEEGAYEKSYACLVLARAGSAPYGWISRLREAQPALEPGVRCRLAGALLAAGKRRAARELLGTVGPGTHARAVGDVYSRDEHGNRRLYRRHARAIGGSLRSPVRDDALLLAAWLDADPQSEFVPVLASRLEAAQSDGRWGSTQDNAVALMALGKYCRTLAAAGTCIAGRLERETGAPLVAFRNKQRLQHDLTAQAGATLRLVNESAAPLYFWWKSEGVPRGYPPEEDRGMRVRREFFLSDGSVADPTALRQGELVIVQISLETDRELDNIVIEELLPGGLEIENPRLKTSQLVSLPEHKAGLPLHHTDLRDDRLLAFTGRFSGRKNFCYAARAITRGTFTVPAASAVCMYDHELRSLHGRETITIKGDE